MQMKIWYFLRWQWRRFEPWQLAYLFAMFLLGCAFAAPEHLRSWFAIPGTAIIIGFVMKWAIYDSIKDAWNRFNKEQEKMVEILKDGQ
jgi:hypothetical protein